MYTLCALLLYIGTIQRPELKEISIQQFSLLQVLDEKEWTLGNLMRAQYPDRYQTAKQVTNFHQIMKRMMNEGFVELAWVQGPPYPELVQAWNEKRDPVAGNKRYRHSVYRLTALGEATRLNYIKLVNTALKYSLKAQFPTSRWPRDPGEGLLGITPPLKANPPTVTSAEATEVTEEQDQKIENYDPEDWG